MRRKISNLMIALALAVCTAGSFSINVEAADTISENEIRVWLDESNARSNPVAVYDGTEVRRASSNKCVASKVWLEYSGAGDAAFASGYTDVETPSGADAYHYTRTEFRRTSASRPVSSRTEYGYGLVSAETDDVMHALDWDDAYGQVHWGD